jgi:hypothetical protein
VGPTYAAALTTGAASKILSGQTLAGVSGNVTLPAQGKVYTGITYGVNGTGTTGSLTLPVASNVKTGSGTYGDPGAALTPSYSPDFPAVGNVLNSDTVDGVSGTLTLPSIGNVYTGVAYGVSGTGSTGTLTIPTAANVRTSYGAFGVGGTSITPSLADCSTDGATGCVTVAGYKSADMTNAVSGNIKSGVSIAGVAGNATLESHIDCAADGALGCVTVAGFKAANMTNAVAGNIKNGVTIAGVAGQYPSATYPLPSASATADFTTLNSQITSSTAFEWWDSAGTRYTGAGDNKLSSGGYILTGNTIFGVSGTVVAESHSNCAADGATGCITVAAYPAAKVANISTWDLRAGQTFGGITGALKTNCRNAVSTAFNYDGAVSSLLNTAVATGTAYDYWDTVDDASGFAANKVTAWSSNTYCDSSTWTDVTTTDGGNTTSTCATSPAACQYKDNITNLVTTKVVSASSTWSAAVNACASSTYGGYAAGTWRLPTQKELMSLYEHGIVSLANANFMTRANMQNYFWSSSSGSTDSGTTRAWNVLLANGDTNANVRTDAYYAVCVR